MKAFGLFFATAALSLALGGPCAFAGQWEESEDTWRYRLEDSSFLTDTWQWIDGNHDGIAECYRFGKDGQIYVNTQIDGVWVDANGAMTSQGAVCQLSSIRNIHGILPAQEANVRLKLLSLRSRFPQGMAWDDDVFYSNASGDGYGCGAFVFLIQDLLFGTETLPVIHSEFVWEEIHIGDHIRFYNEIHEPHSAIVLSKDENAVTIVEGNYNDSVNWGRTFTKEQLESLFIYRETRYS